MTYNYYISSIKKPYLFCGKLCAVTFIIFLFSVQVFAQTHLQRISNSARSDGLGYVVRYHLTAPVDSFDLIQPASDLVQMVLYGTDIDTSGILLPEKSEKLKEVRLYKLEYGYGVDIYLSEDAYYLSTAYLDQNKSHILLALTETTQREAERYSQQFIARNWYREIIPEDALEVTGVEVNPFDDSYNIIKDKLRFDRIVIDPGHGGHDPGNPGYNNSVKEKDIVLSIAKKLGSYIEEHLPGVEVIYTRENDEFVALEERGRIANRAVADLFVSIHADAFPNHQVRGASVFFLGLNRSDMSFEIMKKENQVYQNELVEDLTEEDLLVYELAHSGNIATSERIAYMMEDQLKNRAQRKSRGVKQMGLVVLYQSTMPAILVEAGFLTNPSEQRFLASDYGQNIIASALFRAIRDYKIEYEKNQAYNTSN